MTTKTIVFFSILSPFITLIVITLLLCIVILSPLLIIGYFRYLKINNQHNLEFLENEIEDLKAKNKKYLDKLKELAVRM